MNLLFIVSLWFPDSSKHDILLYIKLDFITLEIQQITYEHNNNALRKEDDR